MDIEIKGMNLTNPDSYVTIVLVHNPLGFLVTFPYSNKLFAKIVNIPGALYGDDSPFPGMFYIPRNRFNDLQAAVGENAKWRTKEDLERDQLYFAQDQETIQDVLKRTINIDTPFMKINPYSFQKLAISWATETKGIDKKVVGGLLADEPGLGKTIEGMAIALYLKDKGHVKNCLIISPATLKTQWQQEIEKFSYEDSVIIRTMKAKDTFKSRQDLYEKIKKEKPFFTIINYEMLIQREVVDTIELKQKTKTGKNKTKKVYGDHLDLNELKDIGYDMVIIDEAHKMKNPDTLISQAIRQIEVKYKLLMTGTPIEKELKNLFQLFDYIDPSILTDGDITDFEQRRKLFEEQYLLNRLNPFTYPKREIDHFGEMNTDVLRKKINPFMLRRLTEDVSDEMPEQVEIKETVDFDPTQLKLYETVTKEMKAAKESLKRAKDDEEREKIDNNFKALSQLRTIICDSPSILLESKSPIAKRIVGKRKSYPTIPKVERYLELIKEICIENDQKVVVFTRYARVARFLEKETKKLFEKHASKNKETPKKLFVYEGKTKQGCKLRDRLEKEGKDKSMASCIGCPLLNECETRTKYAWHFQNDPDTRVLVATDAANFGVNLQRGKYLINYDLPDSFSTYLQRNGRIRRLGSEHDEVFIYNLVTKEGVDEKKLTALEKQMKINAKVVENKDSEKEAIKKADDILSEIIDDIA